MTLGGFVPNLLAPFFDFFSLPRSLVLGEATLRAGNWDGAAACEKTELFALNYARLPIEGICA